jgi:hypothetical protein
LNLQEHFADEWEEFYIAKYNNTITNFKPICIIYQSSDHPSLKQISIKKSIALPAIHIKDLIHISQINLEHAFPSKTYNLS